MGKIVKKYIGDDQVGHIQLELENAGSLRAKSLDGLSSIDLLEYSSANQFTIQQSMYLNSTVNIESFNQNQSPTTSFQLKTSDQAVSGTASGGLRLISGATLGNIASGPLNLYTGDNSLAQRAASTTSATGAIAILSGNITDGTLGTTGSASLRSGNIGVATNIAHAGNTGSVTMASGSNRGVGNTGSASIASGIAYQGASGSVFVVSGQSVQPAAATPLTAVSGFASVASGTIQGGTQGSTGTSSISSGGLSFGAALVTYSGNTGSVSMSSGPISCTNASSVITGSTGSAVLSTGSNNIGAGNTGGTSLFTGSVSALGTGASGVITIQSGGISNISASSNSGAVNLSTGSNTGSGNTGSIQIVTGIPSNGNSGALTLGSGQCNSAGSGISGSVTLFSGSVPSGTGGSGSVDILSGSSAGGNSGNINITTGAATLGTAGSVTISGQQTMVNTINSTSYFNVQNGIGNSTFQVHHYERGYNNSVGIRIFNAKDFSFNSWGIINENGGEFLFKSTMAYASDDGIYSGGDFNIKAASTEAYLITATNAQVNSGDLNLSTQDAYVIGSYADGDSGNINISTGAKQGSGTRGFVNVDASYATFNAMNLKNIADPVDAQDAATKAWVESQISAGTDFHKEQITLSAGDIVNQYVDLAFECLPQSVMIGVGQRVNLYEGSDFTVVVDGGTGGVARVTFAGPSASAGAEALVEGDILFISFVKA
jgi:hypothetical protein